MSYFSWPRVVRGPTTSTDNAISRFDGTNGSNIQNSGVLIDDSNNMTGVVGIAGTAAVGDAAAGDRGEYVRSRITVATNFPATTVWGDMTSISLTAGDWDVTGVLDIRGNSATITSSIAAAISVNSGITTTDHQAGDNMLENDIGGSTQDSSITIADYRINVSSTTTVYFKVNGAYSAGNPQYRCRISARRPR